VGMGRKWHDSERKDIHEWWMIHDMNGLDDESMMKGETCWWGWGNKMGCNLTKMWRAEATAIKNMLWKMHTRRQLFGPISTAISKLMSHQASTNGFRWWSLDMFTLRWRWHPGEVHWQTGCH
jgi:hypothetical protein